MLSWECILDWVESEVLRKDGLGRFDGDLIDPPMNTSKGSLFRLSLERSIACVWKGRACCWDGCCCLLMFWVKLDWGCCWSCVLGCCCWWRFCCGYCGGFCCWYCGGWNCWFCCIWYCCWCWKSFCWADGEVIWEKL